MTKTMANDFFDDLARKEERVRTQTINNKSYTIRCTDPYGHWHVEAKNVPVEISGSFTTAERAWMAIQAYEDGEELKKTAKNPKKEV